MVLMVSICAAAAMLSTTAADLRLLFVAAATLDAEPVPMRLSDA
jgi:hypothetical protein